MHKNYIKSFLTGIFVLFFVFLAYYVFFNKGLRSENAIFNRASINWFRHLGKNGQSNMLKVVLDDSLALIPRKNILIALTEESKNNLIKDLIPLLIDSDPEIRSITIDYLIKNGDESIPHLLRASRDQRIIKPVNELLPILISKTQKKLVLGNLDLSGIDLSDQNLSNYNFHNSNLSGANLENSNLANARLSKTSLRDANLNNANLQGVIFQGAVMKGAMLANANLDGSDITLEQLSEADSKGAIFHNCKFSNDELGSALFTVDFSGCVFDNLSFTGSYMNSLNLESSSINNVKFLGSEIMGSSFKGSTLKNVAFIDTVISEVDFQGADLENISFSNVTLTNIDFHGVDLHKVAIKDSTLDKVNLLDTNVNVANLIKLNELLSIRFPDNMSNQVLSDLILPQSDFSACNLTGSDFSKSKLTGSNFSNTDLTNIIAKNAIMNNTVFDYSIINNANFSGADLSNASLKGATISDSNFSGSDLYGTNFIGVSATGSNFSSSNLTSHQLHDFNLVKALNLSFMDWPSTDLFRMDLQNFNFSSSNLQESNFSFSDLENSSFFNASCKGANFTFTNLKGANFTNSDLTGVDFSGAELEGATFTGSSIQDAIFFDTNGMTFDMIQNAKNADRSVFYSDTQLGDFFNDVCDGKSQPLAREYESINPTHPVFYIGDPEERYPDYKSYFGNLPQHPGYVELVACAKEDEEIYLGGCGYYCGYGICTGVYRYGYRDTIKVYSAITGKLMYTRILFGEKPVCGHTVSDWKIYGSHVTESQRGEFIYTLVNGE